MHRMLKPLAGALLAFVCLISAASAQQADGGRQITPKDITELESFGRAAISPDGRWAVYEKRGPYDSATGFDRGERALWTIMDLWAVDLAASSPAPARLLPSENLGLLLFSWAPDGRRLLITRRQGDRYEFGVVTLEDRSVRWTGLTPEFSRTGAAAEWVSADTVVLSIRPDNSLPEYLRYDGGAQARLTESWRRSAEGREPSRQVIEAHDGVITAEAPTPPGALVLFDVRDGGVRRLVDGTIRDFAVSPDRHRIAVVTSGEAIRATDPMVQLEGPDRRRLSLIDLSNGRVRKPLEGRDLALSLLRWSPDSTALLVWAREDGRRWTDGALLQVGDDEVLTTPLGGLVPGDDRQINSNLRADWVGGEPVLLARAPETTRLDWYRLPRDGQPVKLTGTMASAPGRLMTTSGDGVTVAADGALWRLGAEGASRLTPEGATLQGVIASGEPTRRLSTEAPRLDWTPLMDASGTSFTWSDTTGLDRLGGDRETTRAMAVSRSAALVLERTGLEETLFLRRGGGAARLDAVNSGKREVQLIEPVPVRHEGVDGREVTDWLYLPPGRSRADLRGLIVQVYPGQGDAFVWHDPLTQTYGIRPTLLAGAGFAVLSPAVPRNTPPGERGDEYVRVVDLAVDAALAAHPELPSDRIGVLGHSFGGYMAMEMAVRSRRYRSYVASSGLYDMMGLWGGTDPASRLQPEDGQAYLLTQAFVEVGQAALNAPPWDTPDLYLGSSPFLRAGEVTAPIMLLTADLDFVPMSQAEMMFSALYREGKTARLVAYWGEHHHPLSPANIQDRYQEIFDWFDQTLAITGEAGGPATGAAPTSGPTTRTRPPP